MSGNVVGSRQRYLEWYKSDYLFGQEDVVTDFCFGF